MTDVVSVRDWESEIGAQVRRARILEELTQAQLAERANISVPTVSALEAGRGSSLATVIRVARALGKEDWLSGFEPEGGFDPFDVWRQNSGRAPRQRVRKAG